uniref:DM domain-containing protein n=1 Tax=Meloidogyne incognita TaxID=6306 RepID=A0A914L1T6_MELIC
MIDQQQQHLLLHHHNNNHLPQHCHQWIPPLGNSLLHNQKEMRKSATTITKETSSPYIVAEFIPPRLDTENEENGKKEGLENKRKLVEGIEDSSPTSSTFSSPQPPTTTTTATKNINNIYTIPPQQQTLLSSLEENEEEEKNKNLIDILSYTPTPLTNKQFENVLSETTTTALSSGGSSCADFDDPKDKKYFCQRCLNHKEEHPRKGHKPFCRYRDCQCAECQMVEKRRRLNNALNTRKPGEGKLKGLMGGINLGPKARNPMCARCTAHGKESALRGHKKAVCPFRICECEKCGLVEERRRLMAAQIKLRRRQKKAREGGTDDGSIDDEEFCEILNSSSSPLIGINKEINNTKIILNKQKKPRQQYKPRKQWNNSNNFLIESRKELNFGGGRLSLEKHQTTNFQHFQEQISSKINLQQKQQASLNLFLNNSNPRQFPPFSLQQPQQQPTQPQITSNLISAYLNSIASQQQQQQQTSINSQHIFVASQPIPLQQQPLTPLQIATLVNNTQQQKLPLLPYSLPPSTTTNPSLPLPNLPPLPTSSFTLLPSSSTINTSSPPSSQNASLLPLPFQLPSSSLPSSSSTNSSPPSSSSSNLIYEWLYSLPTSLLAQIPPINLIQPPQQPFDTAQQTNLQSTLQTLNFMRLNNLAENSKAMETEEENEDDNRKRATASEGIQQLSDRTPVLFSTPPLTQQTLTNNVTPTNLINPLILQQQQTIIPSQELSSSSNNLNNSSSNPFCINSLLSLFNQVSQQQQ